MEYLSPFLFCKYVLLSPFSLGSPGACGIRRKLRTAEAGILPSAQVLSTWPPSAALGGQKKHLSREKSCDSSLFISPIRIFFDFFSNQWIKQCVLVCQLPQVWGYSAVHSEVQGAECCDWLVNVLKCSAAVEPLTPPGSWIPRYLSVVWPIFFRKHLVKKTRVQDTNRCTRMPKNEKHNQPYSEWMVISSLSREIFSDIVRRFLASVLVH